MVTIRQLLAVIIAGYKDNLTRNANINAYAQYDFSFGLTAKATFIV